MKLSFGGGAYKFGTFTTGGFTINFALASGVLAPVHFHEASAQEYNLAVSKLNAKDAKVNTAAADSQREAAAAAAAAQRRAALEAAISTASSTVDTDLTTLAASSSKVLTLAKQMVSDMQNVTKALATTKLALQQDLSLAARHTSTACYDANSTVAYSARQTVAYAARQTVEYAAQQTVVYYAKSLGTAITTLRTAFSIYQRSQTRLPSFVPTGAPTKTEVTSSIQQAHGTVASAVALANGYISRANSDVATAYNYVDQAYRAGNCGTPPSPTPPVPTIK